MLFAAVALLLLQAAPAQETPPSRAGLVLFKMPAGRERKEEATYTVLKSTGDPAKSFDIRIRPAATAAAAADAVIAHEKFMFGENFSVRAANDPGMAKHSAGYNVCSRPYFLTSRDGRESAVYVFGLQSGTKSVILEFIAPNAAILADARPIVAFVENCRLAHAELLVPGPPPLSVYDVEETLDFLQWFLELSFTAEQREIFRDDMIDGWKKKDADTIQGMATLQQLRAQLAALSPDQQDVVRKQTEGQAITELRKETDRAAKLMVQIYDASRKPLAEGDPALTRQQTDSALELFYFMAGQLEGMSPRPTAEEKNEWAKRLTEGWAKVDPAIKKTFAAMPLTWAATRAGWAEMPAADKEGIQKGFAQMDFIKELRTHFAKAKSQDAGDASAALAKMQQNHTITASLLKTGYDSTMTQMAAMRNMTDTRNHWSYRPR